MAAIASAQPEAAASRKRRRESEGEVEYGIVALMKILYYGGQKSGKSRLAEEEILALASGRTPCYIATYDSGYGDEEMARRIAEHRRRRAGRFVTLEEPRALSRRIEKGGSYLIDCMSMWIFNTLKEDDAAIEAELQSLAAAEAHIVFVLDEVGAGVVPPDRESRRYVDRSGWVGQRLAQLCDRVYAVRLGLRQRLK